VLGLLLYDTYINADFMRYFPSTLTKNMRSSLVMEFWACSLTTKAGPFTHPLVYLLKISSTGYNCNVTTKNIETVSCPCNTCFWYARALAVRNFLFLTTSTRAYQRHVLHWQETVSIVIANLHAIFNDILGKKTWDSPLLQITTVSGSVDGACS